MNQHFWSTAVDLYSFHGIFTHTDLSLKNENFRSLKVLYSYKAYFSDQNESKNQWQKKKSGNYANIWKLNNTHKNNPFIYAKLVNLNSKFIYS